MRETADTQRLTFLKTLCELFTPCMARWFFNLLFLSFLKVFFLYIHAVNQNFSYSQRLRTYFPIPSKEKVPKIILAICRFCLRSSPSPSVHLGCGGDGTCVAALPCTLPGYVLEVHFLHNCASPSFLSFTLRLQNPKWRDRKTVCYWSL